MRFLAFLAAIAALVVSPSTGQPPEKDWRVRLRSAGSVRFGMSVEEAEAQVGELRQLYERDGDCYFVEPARGPEGLSFMVLDGRIVRVDVQGVGVRTLSGAGVGDSEEAIKNLYPGQIEVTDHAYTGGHYLYFRPRDPADRKYSLVFETDQGIVERFRAGLLPPARWVEGCS